MDNWIPFQQVNFSDKSIFQYYIDTRDFHCLTVNEKADKDLNLPTLLKYPKRFFRTPQEVVDILTRLYKESGGEKRWRFLSLCHEGKRYTEGWQIKYLRIHRTEHGLVVCNNNHYALSMDILNCKVNAENL